MAIGKRPEERQQELWLATQDIAKAPGHPFYAKLNELLRAASFDRYVEDLCKEYYHEPDMPEQVIREALPLMDAIAIQPTTKNSDPDFYSQLDQRYGKPIYIADHVSSYQTTEYSNTMEPMATDPESYVEYYTEYVTAALSHPALIGYNRCQYQDQLPSPGFLKQGMLEIGGTPRSIVDGIRAANLQALESAYSFLRAFSEVE